jgi:hypothetical protein
MTRSWHLLLALALAVPAWAQEEPAVEETGAAPAEETGATPVEDAGAAEASGSAEAAAPEEAPLEEIAVEEISEDSSSRPVAFYGGVDLVSSRLSTSADMEDLHSGIYRIHAGARPIEGLALEVQAGIHEGSDGPGLFRTESYVGAFVIPSIRALDTFDLSFPVGYANTAVIPDAATKENLHSVAYGFEAALPMRAFSENLPDLRFTLGGMVYYQKGNARIYGVHAGLVYGFGG